MKTFPHYPWAFKIDEFIESKKFLLEDYVCSLCHGIVIDCYMDRNAIFVCGTCMHINLDFYKKKDKIFDYNKNQIILIEPLVKMIYVDSIVESSPVYCQNKEKGCLWFGSIKEFLNHVTTQCAKENVKCKNNSCSKEIMREEHYEHTKNCLFD
jgi:hypothetical protein